MSSTITMSRAVVLGCAKSCGLGGVLALMAVALNSRGGSTLASMGALSKTMLCDRHTMRDYVASAADAGYLKESGTRNRKWRRLTYDGGPMITFSADAIKQHAYLGDALALAVLIRSLATDHNQFVINFDKLAELAGCSRDSLDRKWRRLEEVGWAARQRKSRSEYAITIRVPENVYSGTPADFAKVQRLDSIADLRARALAILKGGNS